MKNFLRLVGIAAGVCATAAQPIPKLNSVSHEYIQRGSRIEFTITGENLGDTKPLIGGEPGVELKLQAPSESNVGVEASGGGIAVVTKRDPNKVVGNLNVDGMAVLGPREIRLASPSGVSNPQTIFITSLPQYSADSKATSLDKALAVPLPFAVTGQIAVAAESDFYKFSSKKGERIVFEVIGQRLPSPIDSSLAVLNKNGSELGRNEDSIGNDSVLEFVAPEDGEYFVTVRDYRLQGGNNYRYRLTGGAFPFVRGAFPFGGRRGEETEVQLSGINLQGAEKMTLQLNPSAKLGTQELRASSPKGLSNPFQFVVSDLPQVIETEPNTSLTHANSISLPAAINGRIQSAKDYDAFRFRAEKDQRWVFDVLAQRFGSPLDALLMLLDENGNVLQKNDDSGGPDARIDHTFGATGDYFLIVEDLLERGGPEFAYRISCSRPAPDFEVKVVNDTPRISRGGRAPVRCEITRANGFNEPIRITAKSLPAGLHAEPLVLTQNDPGAGLLFISVAPDAALGTSPLALEATGVINGKTLIRPVKAFSMDRAVQAAYVTVLESAPFLVHAGQLLATVEQDQSVNFEALIERRDGFAGEVKVSLEGFSAGREPATKSFDYQPVTIKGNESRGAISAKAKLDSEIGARMVALRGEANVNGETLVQYSAPFPVATSETPFVLSTTLKRLAVTVVPEGSQSSAGEAVFIVRANRRAGFNGDITLQLEGAPEGIAVTIDKIAGNTSETTVKLLASDKAVSGKESQLTITGVGIFKDKTYRYKPQAVALQVNAPESTEVKTAGTTQ